MYIYIYIGFVGFVLAAAHQERGESLRGGGPHQGVAQLYGAVRGVVIITIIIVITTIIY